MNINTVNNKIYVNVNIDSTEDNGDSILAKSDRTGQIPILDKPEDYYMAITRFSIDASDIPLLIPDMRDLVDTNYVFSMRIRQGAGVGFFVERAVRFISEDKTGNPPVNNGPPAGFNVEDRYFWLYSYQTLIDAFNVTLETLNGFINVANGGLTPVAPYFILDRTAGRINLVMPKEYVDENGDVFVDVGFNIPSLPFFESFPYFKNETWEFIDPVIWFNYQRLGEDGHSAFAKNGAAIANPPDFYLFKPEFTNIGSFSSFKSLVFISQSLPIKNEYIESNILGGQRSFRKIITDFTPDVEKFGDQRGVFSFSQQGPYRLIDLRSTMPLYRLDFQVYWQDKNETLHPLLLRNGTGMNVKFIFVRKSTYTG